MKTSLKESLKVYLTVLLVYVLIFGSLTIGAFLFPKSDLSDNLSNTNLFFLEDILERGDIIDVLDIVESFEGSTLTIEEFEYLKDVLIRVINLPINYDVKERAYTILENLDCHIVAI